jgi:hypothetical protein
MSLRTLSFATLATFALLANLRVPAASAHEWERSLRLTDFDRQEQYNSDRSGWFDRWGRYHRFDRFDRDGSRY